MISVTAHNVIIKTSGTGLKTSQHTISVHVEHKIMTYHILNTQVGLKTHTHKLYVLWLVMRSHLVNKILISINAPVIITRPTRAYFTSFVATFSITLCVVLQRVVIITSTTLAEIVYSFWPESKRGLIQLFPYCLGETTEQNGIGKPLWICSNDLQCIYNR